MPEIDERHRTRRGTAKDASQPSRIHARQRGPWWRSRTGSLEQLTELPLGYACVANNASHGGVGVDRIMSRNGDDPHSVRHHDVLSLSRHPETGFIESVHCSNDVELLRSCQQLDRHFNFAEVALARKLPRHRKILLYGVPNVCQSLFFWGPLRPAARQTRARYTIAVFCSRKAQQGTSWRGSSSPEYCKADHRPGVGHTALTCSQAFRNTARMRSRRWPIAAKKGLAPGGRHRTPRLQPTDVGQPSTAELARRSRTLIGARRSRPYLGHASPDR